MKRLFGFAINAGILVATLLMMCGLCTFTGSALGQDFKRPDGSVPLPMDWSDQHVIYTADATGEQAEKMQSDPRYFVATRLHGKALGDASAANGFDILRRTPRWEPREPRAMSLEPKKDWSVSLGAGGVAAGQYPAKFDLDAYGAPSCTGDYAVFPVNTTTGYTRASVVGTFATGGSPPGGATVTVTVTPTGESSVILTLTSSTTLNTGTNFKVLTGGGTPNAEANATSLANAINRNLSATNAGRIAAIAASTTRTVTIYTLTPGSRVALTATTSFTGTVFSFGTVTAGVNGAQANIVGFNYLYSGTTPAPFCTGKTSPEFIFSYASGTGAVATSPVVSVDGTKIAYIENGTNIGAVLHVLTFASGSTEYGTCTNTGTALPTCAIHAVVPGSTAGSKATDFAIPLLSALATEATPTATPVTDTRSAPFVNYNDDVLFVGDDVGHLYSVTSVFTGTPTLAGGKFPVLVSNGNLLNSPVVDVGGTGNVFIGDSASNVFAYTPAGVIVGTSQSIGNGTEGGIHDAAIVDSTNSKVYFTTNCSAAGGTQQLAQIPFSATGFGTAIKTTVTTGSGCTVASPQYALMPDNLYYTAGINSATEANNGHVVLCYEGTTAVHLAQWGFVSGALQTTAQFNDSSFVTTAHSCSPITEFYGDDVAYTPTALTQTGTTVTVTTAANLFVSGQVVTIAGVAAGTGGCTAAAVAAINREQTVTVISSTQFSFTSEVSATIASGACKLTGSSATGPAKDYLFFGTSQPSVWTFTLPMTSNTQTGVSNTTSATGGTSGMVVDNDSTAGQASSIYFSTQATSTTQCGTTAAYCAVKLTQAGLQ